MTTQTDAEKHQLRVDAVCEWMDWTEVKRHDVRCWRHFVPEGKDGKMTALHEPVSTWNPWNYREDLYWVLRVVREKRLDGKLGKSWLELDTLELDTLVGFALDHPRDIMELVWTLARLEDQ